MAAPRKTPQDRLAKAVKQAEPSIIELVSDPDAPEAERIPLFSIDGTTYSMPTEVDAAASLRVLDVQRRQGEQSALSYALEELVGSEGYQALLNFRGLKKGQLENIMELVQRHALGNLEEQAKN
jgi:hypothetical protein